MEFCTPDHKHDALCDPALAVERKPFVYDPLKGHRAHMERIGQRNWLAWQLTRPLNKR